MKSAKELFQKYRLKSEFDNSYLFYEGQFEEALAEHDIEKDREFLDRLTSEDSMYISKLQVKKLIDEIKQKYCIDKWFDKDEVTEILLELKSKLEAK